MEYALTEQQLEAFRMTFSMYERDGPDGWCSWEEDFAAMFRAVNQCPTNAEIAKIISEWDKDKTDRFNVDTFLKVSLL